MKRCQQVSHNLIKNPVNETDVGNVVHIILFIISLGTAPDVLLSCHYLVTYCNLIYYCVTGNCVRNVLTLYYVCMRVRAFCFGVSVGWFEVAVYSDFVLFCLFFG